MFSVTDISGQLQGEWALKRLKDINRLDRFQREIEALRRLDNPGIIKIIDHSPLDDDGSVRPYIVMPLASEGDATKRLPLFTGKVENVVSVGLQVARSLAAAHQERIIHRDIKPGNLLFPGPGFDVWLADFGICRFGDGAVTPDGAVMGPRHFSAPEIEAGNFQNVDPSVDIYSLGQVIFYLLSGGRTFARENVLSSEHDEFFPDERSGILRLLLSRMVAPSAARLQTVGKVEQELARVLDWVAGAHRSPLGAGGMSLVSSMNAAARTAKAKAQSERDAEQQQQLLFNLGLGHVESYLSASVESLGQVFEQTGEWQFRPSIMREDVTFSIGGDVYVHCFTAAIKLRQPPNDKVYTVGVIALRSMLDFNLRRFEKITVVPVLMAGAGSSLLASGYIVPLGAHGRGLKTLSNMPSEIQAELQATKVSVPTWPADEPLLAKSLEHFAGLMVEQLQHSLVADAKH